MSQHDYGAVNHRERPAFKPTRLVQVSTGYMQDGWALRLEFNVVNGPTFCVEHVLKNGSGGDIASTLERMAQDVRQLMLDYARAR